MTYVPYEDGMDPDQQDASALSRAAVTGSPFWLIVIGFWLVLFVIAGTLALGLAIWNLIEAF